MPMPKPAAERTLRKKTAVKIPMLINSSCVSGKLMAFSHMVAVTAWASRESQAR